MSDTSMIVFAAAALTAFLLTLGAALRGWTGWLRLKEVELSRGAAAAPAGPSPAARIELADLKERVRRLEAIANGVES